MAQNEAAAELRLQYDLGGGPRWVPLVDAPVRIGRGGDNDLVLPHTSVSRRHLVLRPTASGGWLAEDLGSTNGLKVNDEVRQSAELQRGDRLQVGRFELQVVQAPPPQEPATRPWVGEAIPEGTIVRRLADVMGSGGLLEPPSPPIATSSRPDTNARGYLDSLNRLARDLLRAESEEAVLRMMLDVLFGSLRVDRAFVLVGGTFEDLTCELMRDGDRVRVRPQTEVPISQTILRTVMEDQVGLLTLDALDDQRLLSGESIRVHGIRSAMCAPLWAEGGIVGFVQVDSPFQEGRFGGADLDFLITVANYGAVGVERLRQRRSRARLERYHSPAVVSEVLNRDFQEGEERGLRQAEVSVLFGDLVGFTALSEQLPMQEVAELLEGYFTRASRAVFDQGGTLDKFIGDCVMAFFGAPLQHEDHAARAVHCAVELMRAVRDWNRQRVELGKREVQIRIGINSGPVLVGDVGSRERVDYTVLGNTVNVAQRLESSVAQSGWIVVSDDTLRSMESGMRSDCRAEPLGEQVLKGLSQRTAIWRLHY